MVVVMAEGVTMATAAVHDPSHALTRMLVHKEHGVHGHPDDATHFLQILGNSWHGRTRIGHPKFQVSHSRQEGVLVALLVALAAQPPSATRGAGGVATSATTASPATAATAASAASAAGAASAASTGVHVLTVSKVHTGMVAEGKHIGAVHFGRFCVKTKAAPLVVRTVGLDVQHCPVFRNLQFPCDRV